MLSEFELYPLGLWNQKKYIASLFMNNLSFAFENYILDRVAFVAFFMLLSLNSVGSGNQNEFIASLFINNLGFVIF